MTLGNVFLEIFQKQSNQSKNKQMGLWQTKKASAKEVKFSQLCPTLCNPLDYTVHGILQARILEWVAFPFTRGSSQPRDWTQVSHIAGGFFTSQATREALCTGKEITKWEGNLWNERKYLQITSDKGLIFKTYKKLIQPYSKTKHTHTHTLLTQLKSGWRTSVDIFPKKTYKLSTGTWIGVQHH